MKELLHEYLAESEVAVESHEITFPDLVKHCHETRYCEATYDSEGRKIIGVRGKATVESQIKVLEEFFGNIRVHDLRVANLRAYRIKRLLSKNRRGEPMSVATVNREMSTLRAMLNEAVVNDWLTVNPFKKVRAGELISIADERKRETVLTAEEEQKLLEACGGESRRHLKALVIAAPDTGARLGELLQLRWSDVDFEDGVIKNITSYKGKTVQRREVPLPARLKSTLLELKEKRGPAAFRRSRKTGAKPDSSLVFGITSNVQRSWEAARVDAGLEHLRFHDLRHTAATRLAQNMQLAMVSQLLGHSDQKTTHRYVNKTREVIHQARKVLEEWQENHQPSIESDSVN